MYAFYKQVHPPTGLENALYCNFFSAEEKNLIVSGVNQLHVYRLNSDIESSSAKQQNQIQDSKQSKKRKLECLASFPLFGNVVSMQTVRLAGATLDALLLSFAEAKLSLVEYDSGTHDLRTSSLHYFEDAELKDNFCQQSFNKPIVRVDPENRCAVMYIYGTRLVVLPFRRDTATDEDGLPGSSKPPIQSTYVIDLRKLDEKITSVKDIQFLHGYYEPTVLILFEPLPTWVGRVAVRKDTCNIVAISLNIQQRVHPIIWSVSSLPFDCLKVLPIPKPIGGVLVFAVNSLIHLNQSCPPFGVSLNSHTEFSTEFILKPQDGIKMSLDCAHACLISGDKMVISLKGGELYVLTLMVDGMRSVRGFNFDKAAASVLTTCMCMCDQGYLFLGSRLGNSLLLRYTEKAAVLPTAFDSLYDDKDEEQPNKKQKTEALGDWLASDVSAIDDLDELEVYGSDTHAGTQLTAYTFEVCDSIMNIGPCGRAVMGEPAFLSEEFSPEDPDVELVTTSGYGKNGALSVLQRTIRPQVVTTFELPGCTDMWTVIGSSTTEDKDNKEPEEILENSHGLLIMSREDSTMILQTGQEITELDHSGFSTQGATVFAGNIGDNKYIIQVSPMGIRLLEGVKQLQHIPIDVGSPIISCSMADPYIILLSEAGQLMLLQLKPDSFGSGVRLTVLRPQVPQTIKIVAIAAYKDVSNKFTTSLQDNTVKPAPVAPEIRVSVAMETQNVSTVDEEDDMLYGESDITMPGTEEKEEIKEDPSTQQESNVDVKPTFWCAMTRDNGVLEIYSLPDFKLAFLVKSFPMGYKVLVDSFQQGETPVRPSTSGTDKPREQTEMPEVKELLIVGLGNKCSKPYLLARVDDEVLMYEAFPYITSTIENHLKIRFKKIQHGLILKQRQQKEKKRKDSESEVDEEQKDMESMKWFRPFRDISGYAGVFICGPYPHWLFMTPRGSLRIHPMGIDGSVTCFAHFHNVNCPKGFLYFNRQGELRISVLPTHLSYDAPWPVRKVPLRCTPHFCIYHPESKTYTVGTSNAELCNRTVKIQADGEKEYEVQDRADERFIYPTIEKFNFQLFSPLSWEAIPNTKIEMEDFEHITCMKYVLLKSEGTVSGLKGYVALGTNFTHSEEVTSKGRIIIFDIIEVVPEPGQPLTKNKIKIEYDKEQKGPVSAMDHVDGYLITAIGQKVYIWQLKENELSGVAFIDTNIYIHEIVTLKSLILAADICKSFSLMRYQTDLKVLSLVAKDAHPLESYSTAFMVDNSNVSFIVSDKEKNLIVEVYNPEVRESHGGQRLLRRADINVGSHVNTFFRVKCKLSDPSTETRLTGSVEKRHVTFFASLDGSIGFLLPVAEKVYRRLLMLQNALNAHIPHLAGLNPKAYRSMTTEFRGLVNSHKNILDGDLLWKFLHLGTMERSELAKRIGTSKDQVIEDLMEVDRLTAHF